MKVLISVDLEGASGIVTARECGYPEKPIGDPEATPDYLNARSLLTGDVNAAVEGAIKAGAAEFVLHDSHGLNYRNINLNDLHPSVEVISGMPIIFYEYEDLNNSYDAAFMIAMHARAGQAGIISHVLEWPLIREVRINGLPVGESQLTAAIAGINNIPTVLITGDDVVCNEIKDWTRGEIETAIVKKSLSRYCARCLPLDVARERIRQAAFRAIQRVGEIKPSRFEPPITLEVEFNDRQIAWYVSWMPETKYNGDRTVSYTHENYLSVYKSLLAMFWIANSKLSP
jgi:D-amino peptidase